MTQYQVMLAFVLIIYALQFLEMRRWILPFYEKSQNPEVYTILFGMVQLLVFVGFMMMTSVF